MAYLLFFPIISFHAFLQHTSSSVIKAYLFPPFIHQNALLRHSSSISCIFYSSIQHSCLFHQFIVINTFLQHTIFNLICAHAPVSSYCMNFLVPGSPVSQFHYHCQDLPSMGTASADSVESDLGCTARIYFDNLALT